MATGRSFVSSSSAQPSEPQAPKISLSKSSRVIGSHLRLKTTRALNMADNSTTRTAAQPIARHHTRVGYSNDSGPGHRSKLPSQSGEDEDDDWLVSCRCESARAFTTLLQCLRHATLGAAATSYTRDPLNFSQNRRSATTGKHIQPVTVFCSPNNLTFHAHGSKQLQASVDIPAGLFSLYRVAQPDNEETSLDREPQNWQAGGEFCINLTTLLECLQVLLGSQQQQSQQSVPSASSTKTKLCFSYNMTQELFTLELLQQDSNILMTAAIPGMVAPEQDSNVAGDLAHAFRSYPHSARFIVKSSILRDVVQELECVSGASTVDISMSKRKAGLEVTTCGSWGEVDVFVPAKGSHVVSWEPPRMNTTSHQTSTRTFSLKALLASLQGLDIAEETCITLNENGMMAIQHQVIHQDVGDGSPCFVDYIMCCMEPDSEEENDNDTRSRDASETCAHSLSFRSTSSQDRSLGPPAKASMTHSSIASDNSASVARSKSLSNHLQTMDDSESDGFDTKSHVLPSSVTPLFGPIVPDSKCTSQTHRRTRSSLRGSNKFRRLKRSSRRNKVSKESDDGSNGSRNLLESSGSDDSESSSSSDEEESQPLDVTAKAMTPKRRRLDMDNDRESDCSSPEIVYGLRH